MSVQLPISEVNVCKGEGPYILACENLAPSEEKCILVYEAHDINYVST